MTSPRFPCSGAEAISRDIFIALFAGQPKRIHIREPFEGVRFGVESRRPSGDYVVDQRQRRTVTCCMTPMPIMLVEPEHGARLDVWRFRGPSGLRGMGNPRGVALHLEQRPFVQIFVDSVAESEGSVPRAAEPAGAAAATASCSPWNSPPRRCSHGRLGLRRHRRANDFEAHSHGRRGPRRQRADDRAAAVRRIRLPRAGRWRRASMCTGRCPI